MPEEPEASWFGLRLRELREEKGLTLKRLAELAELTSDGIVKLERGVRLPNWDTVLRLAKALGVEVGAFTVAPQERERPGPGRPKKQPQAPATPTNKDQRQRKAK